MRCRTSGRSRLRAAAERRRGLVLALSFVAMALLASTAYALSNWVFSRVRA